MQKYQAQSSRRNIVEIGKVWKEVPRAATKLRGARYLLSAIVLAATAAGASRAWAQIPELKGGPMLDCSGLPCMDVIVSGTTHLKMLIDTGNANSILDEAKAKELGLDLKPVTGPDGKPYPGYSVATIKNVRMGDAALGDLEMLVVNLQPDIQKGSMPVADGTLAYTAFDGRILKLDYKGRRIGVSDVLKADVNCPKDCGEVTLPTFGKHGPPILVTTGFRVNDKPLTVQIDTLYSGTMLVYPTSVEKLGLVDQENGGKKRMFPYTDGGVEMIEGTASSEGFDTEVLGRKVPLYFVTPKVHAPDGMFDGTVGHELFAGHVLIFDFHGHRFWMS